MKEMKFIPTVVTYNTLLAGLGKEGRVKKAMDLFSSMKEVGCPPNTVTFNTFLDCLCKNGEVDLALEMFYKMTEMDCVPDVPTYNTIIYGLAKENRVSDAFWIFNQMRKLLFPDLVTLCTLRPVKVSRIDDAFRVAEDFFNHPQEHTNRTSMKVLIEGILIEVEIDQCIIFAENLLSSRMCQNDSILCPVIKSMCKHKKVHDAYHLFERFTMGYGIQPTLESYNALIDALLEANLTEIAWELFEEMKKDGCNPDIFTYNLLLDALGKSGRIDQLFELHEEMLSRECKPNTITYNILISGLVKSKSLDEARDLYYDLMSGDSIPSPCTYGPLIDGFSKAGRVEEAKQFFG
uniref:Uncharacterized protein n=1 Tax=Nelumbo nucifera TaxID=4432 RepID=A0A822ZAX5_NELNU|nr:TPA_asm: hypothetical protein HUJ06_000502 [Nelumbo nucifera]